VRRDHDDALRAERGAFDVPRGGAGIYFTRLTPDEADVAAKARHEKSTVEVLAARAPLKSPTA